MYERLISRKCRCDERTRRLVGREKVIGRLAGQMASVMYTLLKKDQEMLSQGLCCKNDDEGEMDEERFPLFSYAAAPNSLAISAT